MGDFTGDLEMSSCFLVGDLDDDLLRLFVASFFFNRLALYKEFFSLLFKILLEEACGLLLLLVILFCCKMLELLDSLFTIPWWIPMWSIKLWILLKLLLQILHFLGLELNFSNNCVLKWTKER